MINFTMSKFIKATIIQNFLLLFQKINNTTTSKFIYTSTHKLIKM